MHRTTNRSNIFYPQDTNTRRQQHYKQIRRIEQLSSIKLNFIIKVAITCNTIRSRLQSTIQWH